MCVLCVHRHTCCFEAAGHTGLSGTLQQYLDRPLSSLCYNPAWQLFVVEGILSPSRSTHCRGPNEPEPGRTHSSLPWWGIDTYHRSHPHPSTSTGERVFFFLWFIHMYFTLWTLFLHCSKRKVKREKPRNNKRSHGVPCLTCSPRIRRLKGNHKRQRQVCKTVLILSCSAQLFFSMSCCRVTSNTLSFFLNINIQQLLPNVIQCVN